MLTEQTVNKMVSMKMHKMAESFKERLSRPDHQSLSQSEFVGFLIDDEYQARQNPGRKRVNSLPLRTEPLVPTR